MFNVVACTTSLTIAWFMDKSKSQVDAEASINKSYFEGGSGTENDPYLIKYPIQFYYFSWLQNLGYFNQVDSERPGYYQQYHFQIIDNIDMSDYNLPPAGSSQYPFIGSIDGDDGEGGSYTLSNLHITNTDYTDEPENPHHDDRNYQIMGVFGIVGSYGTMPYSFNSQVNYVQNINLENVTVESPNSSNTQLLMGLVAGYVNDNLSDNVDSLNNIEVSGTSTIVSAASTPINPPNKLSSYTLVGYTNKTSNKYLQDVTFKAPNLSSGSGQGQSAIIDESGGMGGDLVVAPSGLTDGNGNTLYGAFGSDVTSGSRPVDGAAPIPDTNPEQMSAYYFSTVNKRTPSPQPTSFYEYSGNTSTEFSGTKKQINIDTRSATTINANSNTDEGFQSFINYIDTSGNYRVNSQFVGLRPNNSPVFTGITNYSKYPTNCIWFKPMNTGHCFISFGVEKMNSSANMSIYRYKRDANGAYIGLQELELYFNKTNKLGNGSIALFDIYISDIDYEYCIGKSSSSTDNPAYFFFLKLAGADSQGGTGIKEAIDGTDYAVYEQFITSASSMATLEGASFVGDPLASFQLNTMSQTYVFESSESMATVNQTPGSPHVSSQTKSSYGDIITTQIITGYDENNIVSIVMQKVTTGSIITWYYRASSSGPLIATTEEAIGRYFGEHAAFSNTDLLRYHHQITNGASIITPTTTPTVSLVDSTGVLSAYIIATTANKADVTIDYVNTAIGHTLTFNGTGGQIYQYIPS